MPTHIVNTAKLAEILSVTPGTVRKWRRAGIIPTIRINSITYRFDVRAVMMALKGASPPPAAESKSA